jgi:hypothetical protein
MCKKQVANLPPIPKEESDSSGADGSNETNETEDPSKLTNRTSGEIRFRRNR